MPTLHLYSISNFDTIDMPALHLLIKEEDKEIFSKKYFILIKIYIYTEYL